MSEQLQIDWTACDGRGGCAELLPELLTLDEWGYPLTASASGSIDVPDHLVAHARTAVRDCPLMALRLLRT